MSRAQGKVALVTGAARGHGRSCAVRLAEEGADVIAVDLCRQIESVPYPLATSEDLAETARLVEALGRCAVPVRADVRDLRGMREAVDGAVARLNRLDVVVAAAAVSSGGVPSWELPDETWQDLVDVNLTGVWLTCKAAAPHLRAGGSIVIVGSTAGLRPYAAIAHQVAAEHALMGLTKTLAQELGPRGIRVSAVNPARYAAAPVEEMLLPAPRVEPRDVADAVLFLSSDEARSVTGVGLPVDAGVLVR